MKQCLLNITTVDRQKIGDQGKTIETDRGTDGHGCEEEEEEEEEKEDQKGQRQKVLDI